MGKGAHTGAEDAGEMDCAASGFADDYRRWFDVDEGTFGDRLEETNDIVVPEAETAVRQGGADEIFTAGAVNIDIAFVGVDSRPPVDALLEPFQPENPARYQVVLGRGPVPVRARVFTIPEDATRRSPRPDLLLDPVKAGRGLEGVLPAAVAEPGGGRVVSLDYVGCPADE